MLGRFANLRQPIHKTDEAIWLTSKQKLIRAIKSEARGFRKLACKIQRTVAARVATEEDAKLETLLSSVPSGVISGFDMVFVL